MNGVKTIGSGLVLPDNGSTRPIPAYERGLASQAIAKHFCSDCSRQPNCGINKNMRRDPYIPTTVHAKLMIRGREVDYFCKEFINPDLTSGVYTPGVAHALRVFTHYQSSV